MWAEPEQPAAYPDIDPETVRADAERWLRKGPTVHFVGNHVIDLLSGHTASGSVYCWAQLDLGAEFVDQASSTATAMYAATNTGCFSRAGISYGTERSVTPIPFSSRRRRGRGATWGAARCRTPAGSTCPISTAPHGARSRRRGGRLEHPGLNVRHRKRPGYVGTWLGLTRPTCS